MDHDVVTVRKDPELDPDELYRHHILEKVKTGLCLVVCNDQVRITADNINPLLKLLNINTCDEDVLDLIRNALIDTQGEIKTDDFENVVLKRVLTKDEEVEKAIEDAYCIVDVDGDGIITAADIYQLMLALGEMISDAELLHMLKMVDSDGDGRITFEDFRKFILGVEDLETASEEPCEEQSVTNNTEPEPPSVIYQPPPDHKRRRSLFTYGSMVAKQLSVVAQMKSLVAVADDQRTTDEAAKDNIANESDRDTKTQDEKKIDTGIEDLNVEDGKAPAISLSGDVTVETLKDERNIHVQVRPDNDCQAKDERKGMCNPPGLTTDTEAHTTEHSSKEREDVKDNEPDLDEKNISGSTRINIFVGGCSEEFMALMENQPIEENDYENIGKEDNCDTLQTQTVPEKEIKEDIIRPGEHSQTSVVSERKECPPTRYSEKSPYYGRIRPIVFSMNPLPPLDNGESKRKESIVSVSKESIDTDAKPICHSTESKLVKMVDKQIQTSEEFDENMGEFGQAAGVTMESKVETESQLDDTDNMPLRRNSATITEVRGIPERLRKMKCLQKAILKRRNTSFDVIKTQKKRDSPKVQLQRQSTSHGLFKHLTDRPRQAMSFAERHPCYEEEKEETLMIPSPPKTGFRRFAERFRNSTPPPDSLYDTGYSNNSKSISIIDVSPDMIDESRYEHDVKFSEKHHGFKSIRPLSRVLMALRSNCNAKKVQSEDLTSISRVLEENGTPYTRTSPTFERKATVMKQKTLSRSNTLLNLELPIENSFRPKLKRTSTLTRIPVDTGNKHNIPVFLG